MNKKVENYNVNSIEKVDALTHIKEHPSLYIGDTEDATKIFIEVLDNALDEVDSGNASHIIINIDSSSKEFSISDNGRGIPFSKSAKIETDPPVLITHEINTSGKFRKTSSGSAYKISVGTHGIGLTACNALSDHMIIETVKRKVKGVYTFSNGNINRKFVREANPKFSTKITVKPSEKYFESANVNLDKIKERLIIASINYPNLKIDLIVDNDSSEIKYTKEEYLKDLFGEQDWVDLSLNVDPESCDIKFCWDFEDKPKSQFFTTVNLARVIDGQHVVRFNNAIKSALLKFNKKYKHNFDDNDTNSFIKVYMDLRIIENHFDSQTKERLSRKSNLSILDNLDSLVYSSLSKKGPEYIQEILKSLENYRTSIQSKKIATISKKKRGSNKFTALKDCTGNGGELIIGEGLSAINGLAQVRDPKKHAILPLKGVIPNSLTKKNVLDNKEIKDIVNALGCSIGANFDIKNLRYSKIILAADADPAGHFITCLLITLFAHRMPEIIKNGKLFVCKTPLYGYRNKGKFVPIWDRTKLEELREKGTKILRIKGLGEFDPVDLKVFTLDEKTRQLIQIDWCDKYEQVFELMSNSTKRRELFRNEWELN